MDHSTLTRRDVLRAGAAGAAGLSVLRVTGPASAFTGDQTPVARAVLPWQDQPEPVPPPAQEIVGEQLVWEELDSRLTPNDEFFVVQHYGVPQLSPTSWRLRVDGLVARPLSLSLAALRQQPKRTVEFTMECAGNHGLPFFTGGIGNARWAGAQLRRTLLAARPVAGADEVVFWGADRGTVTIRDNSGITGPGRTGTMAEGGGLTITEQFARSMTLDEAMHPDNLLTWEMNGAELPREHGYPVRLIAPGWYGVANVKWLDRIELTDRRFAGRFMARDYVTVRELERNGETVWTFTTVAEDRLKSAPAKVIWTGARYTVMGAAWGAPISRVEVRIDGGSWQRARLQRQIVSPGAGGREGYAWRFWTHDWGTPSPGGHTVTSRAFDVHGAVQPAPTDPFLANRRTYWEDNGQITRTVVIPGGTG